MSRRQATSQLLGKAAEVSMCHSNTCFPFVSKGCHLPAFLGANPEASELSEASSFPVPSPFPVGDRRSQKAKGFWDQKWRRTASSTKWGRALDLHPCSCCHLWGNASACHSLSVPEEPLRIST